MLLSSFSFKNESLPYPNEKDRTEVVKEKVIFVELGGAEVSYDVPGVAPHVADQLWLRPLRTFSLSLSWRAEEKHHSRDINNNVIGN